MTNSEIREQNNVHIALMREDEEIHKAIGDIMNGRGPNMGGRTVRPHALISPERFEFLIIQQEAARDARKMLDEIYNNDEAGSDKVDDALRKWYNTMPRTFGSRCRTVQLPDMELEH